MFLFSLLLLSTLLLQSSCCCWLLWHPAVACVLDLDCLPSIFLVLFLATFIVAGVPFDALVPAFAGISAVVGVKAVAGVTAIAKFVPKMCLTFISRIIINSILKNHRILPNIGRIKIIICEIKR